MVATAVVLGLIGTSGWAASVPVGWVDTGFGVVRPTGTQGIAEKTEVEKTKT